MEEHSRTAKIFKGRVREPDRGDRSEVAKQIQTNEKKCVTFSEREPLVVEEDPEVCEALRESRKSDYLTRMADRARAERLLGPVLAAMVARVEASDFPGAS